MLSVSTGQYSGDTARQVVQEALTQLTGLDGSSIRYNRVQLADRNSRLNGNVNNSLLHQTGINGCRGIITDGRMNIGNPNGIAGAGIYFAVTADDTMHKTHYHGFLFTVRVRLGNVERWHANKVDRDTTFESLQRRGVDSIFIPRPGGVEFIVYHTDQVELRLVQKIQLPNDYPHGTEQPNYFKYPTPCHLIGRQFNVSTLQSNSAALEQFLAIPRDQQPLQVSFCLFAIAFPRCRIPLQWAGFLYGSSTMI
jgi:hypothetical protein